MRRCLLLGILIITSTRPECAPHAVAVRIVWKNERKVLTLCSGKDAGLWVCRCNNGRKAELKMKKKTARSKVPQALEVYARFRLFFPREERKNREPVRGNSFARKTIQWTRLEWNEEKTHWHTHTHIEIEVTLAEEMPSKSHDKKERKKSQTAAEARTGATRKFIWYAVRIWRYIECRIYIGVCRSCFVPSPQVDTVDTMRHQKTENKWNEQLFILFVHCWTAGISYGPSSSLSFFVILPLAALRGVYFEFVFLFREVNQILCLFRLFVAWDGMMNSMYEPKVNAARHTAQSVRLKPQNII